MALKWKLGFARHTRSSPKVSEGVCVAQLVSNGECGETEMTIVISSTLECACKWDSHGIALTSMTPSMRCISCCL